jgi:ATP-dependent DNA helicase RecQ
MIRQPERSRRRVDRGDSAASPTLAQVAPADQALFEALRALRRQLAQDAGVPPYVVFTDATLRAMAASRPRDAAGLARIPGVGAVKLQSWGPAFLAAIAGHG